MPFSISAIQKATVFSFTGTINSLRKVLEKKLLKIQFALCIENKGCEDIEKRKFYQILPDEEAAREGYLRVIDESLADDLYPESYFIFVELPRKVREAFVAKENLIDVR